MIVSISHYDVIYDPNLARYFSNLHVNIDENFKHLTNKK